MKSTFRASDVANARDSSTCLTARAEARTGCRIVVAGCMGSDVVGVNQGRTETSVLPKSWYGRLREDV